jgi:hypothetical protein
MNGIKPISVDKTLRTFLRLNKKCYSLSNVFRKDGKIDGSATSSTAPSLEKGLPGAGGFSAASSQNYSKLSGGHLVNNPPPATPTGTSVKQTSDQPVSMASGIMNHRTGEIKSDVRKDLSAAVSAEKTNVHVLKTNLDRSSSGQQDDAPLLASRRVDPSTVRQVYYFDTLAFAKKLESKGFTREQAEGCAECLVEIINTTLDHQSRHMVTKPQQEIAVLQLMSEIVSVKKDMTLLQKSEFSSLKTETEKISIELSQVQGHMNDEIVKLKGQFTLDINLERGRAIEAHAENEKKLQQLHNKIETEIANLRTIYEVYRNDVFKYAGGTVIAVGGLMLGVIRLWH